VRILSGEEEARLMFAAFRQSEDSPHGVCLGLDLGGGSLELALGDERTVTWETTLRLGAARMHSEIAHSDPMRAGQVEALRKRVRAQLRPHAARIRRAAPASCFATGGSIRALARLAAGRNDAGATTLSLETLHKLRKKLVAADHDARLQMPGISRRRADLLPCAALILETVADELGFRRVHVAEWGLREGVLLEAVGLACSARSGA
jgi:exopolyphosphatase/guanosine-5'-triphosphate,3'-diphosphate pyrophosphatase